MRATIYRGELYFLRFGEAGLSRRQAAELCGVSLKTFRRWERGETRIPRAALELLRVVGAGYFPRLAGRAWTGWRFAQGKLWSPEGDGFSAGDIRALPYLHALAAEYDREHQSVGKRRAGSPFQFFGGLG